MNFRKVLLRFENWFLNICFHVYHKQNNQSKSLALSLWTDHLKPPDVDTFKVKFLGYLLHLSKAALGGNYGFKLNTLDQFLYIIVHDLGYLVLGFLRLTGKQLFLFGIFIRKQQNFYQNLRLYYRNFLGLQHYSGLHCPTSLKGSQVKLKFLREIK